MHTHVFANIGIAKWWPAVPYRFARAGVVFESLNFWSHFSCSVKGENPNGSDDDGWSWVLVFCCSMMLSCALSLCACGRRMWDSELFRSLFELSQRRHNTHKHVFANSGMSRACQNIKDDQDGNMNIFFENVKHENPLTSCKYMFNYSQVNANVTQPMHADVFAKISIVNWWPAVPYRFVRAGVVFEILNF